MLEMEASKVNRIVRCLGIERKSDLGSVNRQTIQGSDPGSAGISGKL